MFFDTVRFLKPCLIGSLAFLLVWDSAAFAQRGRGGGGGARASMGNVGGGGARPSMGNMGGGGARPNISRPSIPSQNISRPASMPSANVSRPNISRPAGGNMSNMNRPSINRPSLGNAGGMPTNKLPGGNNGLPSLGANRPSLGGIGANPNIQRPQFPNTGSLPNVQRPSLPKPEVKPNIKPPIATLPGSRPGIETKPARPSLPNIGSNVRPGDIPSLGNINRPAPLPGNLDRPTMPGNVARPTPLPGNIGNRPGIGSIPPNLGNRPGNNMNPGNRPIIGGNRPNIGVGGNTNINVGNINVGNSFVNRPNWDIDPGFSRPAWGLGGNWHNHWHNNCIHQHHGWYNGCWHGYWGSRWYAPVVWFGAGWGLGNISNGWGYNYYNPYYAVPTVVQTAPYDYSQPIVVNNYTSASDAQSTSAPIAETTQEQQGLTWFDEGLAHFKSGDYAQALAKLNQALKVLPGDAVVHEVRCLCLFAVGDYQAAAAGLNSLLTSAPGMDWTTMSGLYGKPEDYTQQLRKLEQACKSKPTDASAHFVLAYHYMVTDSKDAAFAALQVVVKNEPKDVTAKRMLEAMQPEAVPATSPTATASSPAASTSETDLVGSWIAQAGTTKIELAVSEESKFTWKASDSNKVLASLTGTLAASPSGVELQTSDQGTIAGTVLSEGENAWIFAIDGAPASDPGLKFQRFP